MRVFLTVLDSVGIGEALDAADYNDLGANTLAHLAEAVEGLNVPVMQQMGLGSIPGLLSNGIEITGVEPTLSPTACFGAMSEVSIGKDTTTGHWEMAGLVLEEGFKLFPKEHPSFPKDLIESFESKTKRKVIGNMAASGTEIIEELGARQMEEGAWIVYTSGDSVFQIAAHEDIIPLDELYSGCAVARDLCDSLHVGRVIARPYIGAPGTFKRTENRRDFSYPLPEPTILNVLFDSGVNVTTVGKLDDVFLNSGISKSFHVENNIDAQNVMMDIVSGDCEGFIFTNLIDFDMLYGHRRDSQGYANALESTDEFLGEFIEKMQDDDYLIITADHGNDPTYKGTDHTREYVPLLVYGPSVKGHSLGIRHGFYDIAQTVADMFDVKQMSRGVSFAPDLITR